MFLIHFRIFCIYACMTVKNFCTIIHTRIWLFVLGVFLMCVFTCVNYKAICSVGVAQYSFPKQYVMIVQWIALSLPVKLPSESVQAIVWLLTPHNPWVRKKQTHMFYTFLKMLLRFTESGGFKLADLSFISVYYKLKGVIRVEHMI